MSHWRKRNPTASRFKTYLFSLTIAIAALFGTLIFLSLHQRAGASPLRGVSLSYIRLRDPDYSLVPFGWPNNASLLRCPPIHT